MRFSRFGAAIVAMAFLPACWGQGGGLGLGSGFAFDPANPDNWEITRSMNGQDNWTTWWWQAGQPMSNSGLIAWPVDPSMVPLVRSISFAPSIGSYRSEGTYNLSIRWIGEGPAPSTVLMKISATAVVAGWYGRGTLSNGIGSVTVDLGIDEGVPHRFNLSASGTEVRSVSVTNGTATLELPMSAKAECYSDWGSIDPNTAVGASWTLVEKSATIKADIDPTYFKGSFWPGYGFHPEKHKRTSMAEFTGETTMTDFHPFPGAGLIDRYWETNVVFDWIRNGDWSLPYASWSSNGTTVESVRHELSLRFTTAEMFSMMRDGPRVVPVNLTVTDRAGSGGVRKSEYLLRVHAPVDNITIDAVTQKLGGWKRVSPIVQGPAKIGLNRGTSLGTSATVTCELSTTGTIKFDELLSIGVSAKTGVSYGETATISTVYSSDFDVPEGVWGCIQHNPFWGMRQVNADLYGSHGFQATAMPWEIFFWSGTRQRAEAADRLEKLVTNEDFGELY